MVTIRNARIVAAPLFPPAPFTRSAVSVARGAAAVKVASPAALLAAIAFAACGAPAADEPDGGSSGASPASRTDTRLVIITHGQSSDAFWSVVANGVNDAARDLGVRVEYQAPTSFDMVRMSEMIEAASASHPNALIVSMPDPAALAGSIQGAIAEGIPVMGINAGVDAWQRLGLIGYLGQTEYEAGVAAGERLATEGATHVLCVNHEVGNASLDERCRGAADALKRGGGSLTVIAVDLADPDDTRQRLAGALTADASFDGMLTLGPAGAAPALAALREAGRLGTVAFGTFDLEPDVLRAIEAGEMLFAIDQQPYLQGYLSVVLMTKYLETGTIAGGGGIVRTGPSFVTRENASAVVRLTEQGIR
jgi:simple sugar transport system substrate-binding protein